MTAHNNPQQDAGELQQDKCTDSSQVEARSSPTPSRDSAGNASELQPAEASQDALEQGIAEYRDDARWDSIDHAKKRAFLTAFCETGTVLDAAECAGVGRSSHYRWLQEDEAYKAALDAAEEIAAEILERIAWQRATSGIKEEVWYQGEKTGERKARSDLLLMFLLKGRKPDRYRDNWKGELTGAGGGEIQVSFGVHRDDTDPSPPER